MMYFLMFGVAFFLTIMIELLLGKFLKKGKTSEKQPVIFYRNLSRRGEFIRSVSLAPVAVAAIIGVHSAYESYMVTGVYVIAMILAFIYQITDSYKKWKREEREQM
ncbi:MAG: hypothetical protein LUF34_03490 [Lachnospiraceae bacterium]|nr:hypothetical protein [Lachnospiraceae bacterium]